MRNCVKKESISTIHVPAYTEYQAQSGNGGYGQFLKSSPIQKGTDITNCVSGVLNRWPDTAATPRIGAFRCLVPSIQSDGDTGLSDQRYLTWLNATLELLLAEFLPSKGYALTSTGLSIWLPTRVRRHEQNQPREEAMRLDFDVHEIDVGMNLVHSVGGKSVAYAIVNTSLAGRSKARKWLAKTTLKLRKIPYWGTGDDNRPSESAVDWYCKHCNVYSGGVPKNRRSRLDRESGIEVKFSGGTDAECWKKGHEGKFLAADYSVASHLADAAVHYGQFPSNQLRCGALDGDISFDVAADERLVDFLTVGRLFDQGRESEGFSLAYVHRFFADGIRRENSFGAAGIEHNLRKRLWEFSRKVRGDTLVQLARS